MITLDALTTESFLQFGALTSTAEALHYALRRRPEVVELRRLIAIQVIEPSTVEEFTRALVQKVELGRRSSYDVVFAALAVIFERVPGGHAAKYLKSLAGLRSAELPLSPRVARLSLQVRAQVVPETSTKINKVQDVPFRHMAVAA